MQEWVSGLVRDRYKTVARLANAIGMTDSGFGRAVEKGTFDVENCLRLAHETNESASRVLGLAGKSEIDALIQKLYGAPPKTTLSKEALDHAARFDAIKDQGLRDAITLLADKYLKLEGLSSGKTSAKPRGR